MVQELECCCEFTLGEGRYTSAFNLLGRSIHRQAVYYLAFADRGSNTYL